MSEYKIYFNNDNFYKCKFNIRNNNNIGVVLKNTFKPCKKIIINEYNKVARIYTNY